MTYYLTRYNAQKYTLLQQIQRIFILESYSFEEVLNLKEAKQQKDRSLRIQFLNQIIEMAALEGL